MAANPCSSPSVTQDSPTVTQSSPRRAGIPHASPWHHPRMTTELGSGSCSCQDLPGSHMHLQVLCPHTQSRDESPVPRCCVGTETPWEAPSPWELTHVLPAPCQCPVSSPAVRARQALPGCGPVSWQQSILHPGNPGAPQPLPRVLALPPSAEREAELTTPWVQVS